METNTPAPITLTAAAGAALDTLLGSGTRPTLRIFLSFLHESGPRLEIAPDAPTDADTVVTVDGLRLCVSSLLLAQAAPFVVDCGPAGFTIESRLDFSEAGGNCGGACGSHH